MLLFMHSFGNFNPRSGTFALYGMIALVISGFVGRLLDRLMPRLIDATTEKKISLAELIEWLETGDFDPADEDNFASWGTALKQLANDRTFLGETSVKGEKGR